MFVCDKCCLANELVFEKRSTMYGNCQICEEYNKGKTIGHFFGKMIPYHKINDSTYISPK